MKICPLPFINCKSMFKILPTNLKLMWPNLSNVVLNNNVIGKILKLQLTNTDAKPHNLVLFIDY